MTSQQIQLGLVAISNIFNTKKFQSYSVRSQGYVATNFKQLQFCV